AGRPQLPAQAAGVGAGDLVRPQQRDRHPGHVVVVAVDDPAAVAAEDAGDVGSDAVLQHNGAGPGGGVDGDVQRVRLDPVVPAQPDREPPTTAGVLVDLEPGVPE